MKDIKELGEQNIEISKNLIKKIGPKKLSMYIIVIIAILGIYGSIHFYNKYKELTIDPNVKAQQETQRLVSVLGKLMELPTGETPTVATISDKDKLKGQSFFDMAENGDILFAYTTAMKAILYRPSINKIINVAPISINQNQNVTAGTKNTAPTNKTQ